MSERTLEELDAEGRVAIDREDFPAALTSFEEVERLARGAGEPMALVYALFHQAWVLRCGLGRAPDAGPVLAEASRLADESGSEHLRWSALVNRADLALDERDWQRAAALAADALGPAWTLDRPLGDRTFLIEIAACAAAQRGQVEDAAALYSTARHARAADDLFDPRSVRVLRERTDTLMAPIGNRAERIVDPLPFEDAVVLAISVGRSREGFT